MSNWDGDYVTDVIAKESKTKLKDIDYLFDWCGNLDVKAISPKMRKDVIALYDVSKYAVDFINRSLKRDKFDAKASFHLEQKSGKLIASISVEYEIDLGLCWTCYDCKRTFTDQKVAFMRSVGGHYQERTVYTCKECESYWYGRENYGKKMPDYLKSRQIDRVREKIRKKKNEKR